MSEEKRTPLSIYLTPRAAMVLSNYSEGSGYGSLSRTVEEIILSFDAVYKNMNTIKQIEKVIPSDLNNQQDQSLALISAKSVLQSISNTISRLTPTNEITLDAIWGFEEDIVELKKSFKAHILKAHTSQPLGKPLHKYEGHITLDEESILLLGKDKDTKENFRLVVSRKGIQDVHLGWDDILKRWRNTRGFIRPLRIAFESHKKTRMIYIYTKKPRAKIFGKENRRLYDTLTKAN